MVKLTNKSADGLQIDLASVLNRYSAVERREYQIVCIQEIVDSINKGADVLIDLPTGTGKTLIYAPVVAEVAGCGRRALVLTATKDSQRRVASEIGKFDAHSRPSIVYGIQEYECPLLHSYAQSWCCAEFKEKFCKPNELGCKVISSEVEYTQSNLVVTNFSKFILTSRDSPYDLIVLDDSHSFENAKEQAYQISLQFALIRKLYEGGLQDSALHDMIENFLNLFSEIFDRCVNPANKEGVIAQEYLVHLANLITDKNSQNIKDAIIALEERRREISWQVYHFIKRCQSPSKYQFYVRKDYYNTEDLDSGELISRMDEILNFVIRARFNHSRVVYVTATPGDVRAHASSCTHREYDSIQLSVTPGPGFTSPEIEGWFDKLLIIVTEDIGDTRQMNFFEKAITLVTEILRRRNERALVLFKNYRDQENAKPLLSQVFQADRLFFIDNSLQNRADLVEELASRSQISLASASSTLWEGINIDGLRLAVVVSPPFIRPHAGHHQDYPHFERRMLVRLQQGIGRIIRNPGDFGVAVLTDNRFMKYIRRTIFSDELRRRSEVLKADQVLARIDEAFGKWSAS